MLNEAKKQIHPTWWTHLSHEFKKDYMLSLNKRIEQDLANAIKVFPPKGKMFSAFSKNSLNDIKVVIIGQDPYHDGRATGLAFANEIDFDNLSPSPSLRKIEDVFSYGDINHTDLVFDHSLTRWAKQGVLMLNTALTVEKGRPGSHSKYWKKFTEGVLKTIAEWRPDCIFMLWGGHAKAYKPLLKGCTVLESVHPVYASYKGVRWQCNNFNEANEILEAANGAEFRILW